MTFALVRSALMDLWRSAPVLWIALALAAIGATGWIMPGIPALAVAVAGVYAARKLYLQDLGEYGALTSGLGLTAGCLWCVWCGVGLLTGTLPEGTLPTLAWAHGPAPTIDTLLATAGLTSVMVTLLVGGALLVLSAFCTLCKRIAAFGSRLHRSARSS